MREAVGTNVTFIMDGINFHNSHWIFNHANLHMMNCHAAPLVLELKYLTNAIIQNCTFGNWTIRKVQNAFIKNCYNILNEGFPTSLNFYNSSAFLENMTIGHENITGKSKISVYDLSVLHIEKSYFVNNAVDNGTIKVLNSSIIMSNCTMVGNQAEEFAGAIFCNRSLVHLRNTYFNYNKANVSGGAIFTINAILQIKNCTFKNNQVYGSGDEGDILNDLQNIFEIEYTGGGAVSLFKSVGKIYKSHFLNNYAFLSGGSICVLSNSSLSVSQTTFENNIADTIGGAISTFNSSLNVSYSIFRNNRAVDKGVGSGGGILAINNSTMKISNVTFSKCYARMGGAIATFSFTKTIMSDSSLNANTESAIILFGGVSFEIDNCMFLNNSTPEEGGAIRCVISCAVTVINSIFHHNRAISGGGAVCIRERSKLIVHNSSFTSNIAYSGGAMFAYKSDFNISGGHYSNNTATEGGIVTSGGGNLTMSNCHISNNSVHSEGGVLYTLKGRLIMSNCQVYDNTANGNGGVVISDSCKIVITTCIFKMNSAQGRGGVVKVGGGTLFFMNTTFLKNYAIRGGVIYAFHAFINITKSFCFGNRAMDGGVLMSVQNTSVFIRDIKINENSANIVAVCNIELNSILELNGCQIESNVAEETSGVLSISNNSLFVAIDSLFKGNSAFQTSTMNLYNSTIYLQHCTFTENQVAATTGGAIAIIFSDLKISNTVFTQHSANDYLFMNTFYTKMSSYFYKTDHVNSPMRIDTYTISLGMVIFQ